MRRKSRMKKERRASTITQQFAQPTENIPQSLDQKVLLLVTGLPYSGKTTFAKYLGRSNGYPIVEGDTLDTGYALSIINSPQAASEFRRLANQYDEERAMGILEARIRGLHAKYVAGLFNSNNGIITESVGFITQGERDYFIKSVKAQIDVAVEIYWMNTEIDTCLQRHRDYQATQNLWLPPKTRLLDGRREITENSLMQMHKKAQLPTVQEGFNKIFYVTAISPGQYEIREQTIKPATR